MMKIHFKTLFASLLLAGLAVIAPLSYAQEVPQATVQFTPTGLSVTAPPVAGVAQLEVRIMGPAGTLVFDARSAGAPIDWALQGHEAEGDYRYEVVVVIDVNGAARQGRASELFQVKGGVVIAPVVPAPRASRSTPWGHYVSQALEGLLTALVPAARAANLTVGSTAPTIYFDDSNDEDGSNATKDWEIFTNGGTSDADTNNYFLITAWEGSSLDNVIWLQSRADGNTENSLYVGFDGDVWLAGNDLVIDRATDRVGIGTTVPTDTLHVKRSDGSAKVRVEETSGTTLARELFKLENNGGPFFIFVDNNLAQSYSFAMGATGDFLISHQQTAGVQFRLNSNGNLTIAGTLTSGSSRAAKRDIQAVDARAVLDKVLALPIAEWTYKQDGTVRHVGPMAEDFYAAFGLGATDKGIASIDTSGVALAAIQGLKTEKDAERAQRDQQMVALKNALWQKDTELKKLKTDLSELKQWVTTLAARGQVAAMTGPK